MENESKEMVMKAAIRRDYGTEYSAIPENLKREIPNAIIEVLKGNNLSLCQAEILLDIVRDGLRYCAKL